MDMKFQATSSEILVQGMMNRGRQMFVDSNPFIPSADEASLRRKVNAKLLASYKLPDKAMTTKREAEGKYSACCRVQYSLSILLPTHFLYVCEILTCSGKAHVAAD